MRAFVLLLAAFFAAVFFAVPVFAADIAVTGPAGTSDLARRSGFGTAQAADTAARAQFSGRAADETDDADAADATGPEIRISDQPAQIAELQKSIPKGLFQGLADNSWGAYGPAISSIWPQIDPPLDPLTAGVEGLNATVTQWCGAGFDKERLKFRKSCGGHRATGYNRVYEMDIPGLTMGWASPDSRLAGPEMPQSSCPYPSEHQTFGERAGPAAGHWGDGIVTATDGSTLFFPSVLYDCKGPGNRQPYKWAFKLSPDGEWSSSGDSNFQTTSGGLTSEPLPDGNILLIGRYYAGIFDPVTMRMVPFKSRGKRFEAKGKYAELVGNGNLTEAGQRPDGALRFFYSGYKQRISEILVRKDDDGLWNVGGPRRVPGVKAAWYTAGMEWLPDQNALMYWGGDQNVRYILFDGEQPEVRVGTYPEIRKPAKNKMHIHEGGLQWDPVNKVVYAFGVLPGDGLFVFRPPKDLRAATTPAPPPRQNLQKLVNAANPGDTLTLNGRWTGARVKKPLTIVCEDGATVDGAFANGQGMFLVETESFTIDGCTMKTKNRSEGTAALFFAHGGNFKVLNTYIEGFGNGILTSRRGWIGDVNLTVRGSSFVNNGIDTRSPGHQIYYGNGGGSALKPEPDRPRRWTQADSDVTGIPMRWSTRLMHGGRLLIEDSEFRGQTQGGHGIKSAAQTTIIKRTTIKQGDAGLAYRAIDYLSGGELILEDVTIVQKYGPAAGENKDLISFAPEAGPNSYKGWLPEGDSVTISRLKATCEGASNMVVVRSWRDVDPMWNGATEADPDGDSEISGCRFRYQRK